MGKKESNPLPPNPMMRQSGINEGRNNPPSLTNVKPPPPPPPPKKR
ncbi:MAG: hypothetical protein ABH870_00710 [bacterium]